MPVTEVVWNWAVALNHKDLERLLRMVSDDVDYLSEEHTKALLWEAANRIDRYNRASKAGWFNLD